MNCDFDIRPFEPDVNSAHPQLMRSLCVEFHDYSFEDKGIMHHKTFSVINSL